MPHAHLLDGLVGGLNNCLLAAGPTSRLCSCSAATNSMQHLTLHAKQHGFLLWLQLNIYKRTCKHMHKCCPWTLADWETARA